MAVVLPFNPFGKDLAKIEASDLSVLKGVAEGWYIEYKGDLVSQKNIAKSVSAFANHYGGWLFYGVQGARDGSNTAGSFQGLSQADVATLIQRIRNAAIDSINPAPYYDHKILVGPCDEIGLPPERHIVIVQVPSGPDAPYIHMDGRIYRRVADASDPKHETDRFILDQLWQRRQHAQERLTAFLQTEPELAEGEADIPYLQLFLLPDPLGASRQRSIIKLDKFIKLMSDPTTPGLSVPCDNFFSMSDGLIGRQIGNGDPYHLSITWKHYFNGSSTILIPLSSINFMLDPIEDSVSDWLDGYDYGNQFLEVANRRNHSFGTLIDSNLLIFVVMSAINQQLRLMAEGNIEGPLYAKAILRNIWRVTPYFDTSRYMSFVSNYGLPVVQYDETFIPPGTAVDTLLLIQDAVASEDAKVDDTTFQALNAAELWSSILYALGIPTTVALPLDGAEKEGLTEFWFAALRAADRIKGKTLSS